MVLKSCVLLSVLTVVSGGAQADWEQGSGFRRRALSVPEGGSSGFALMSSEQTGVTFQNELKERSVALNRIYENGSGVASADVNGDGLPDLYFCNQEGGNRLYLNMGDWKFTDVTEESGVGIDGKHSTGCVFADVDGDRDADLFVNAIGGGTRLFINDGSGRFSEQRSSDFNRQGGATSMALADIDGDGDLDLYVAHYQNETLKDAPPGLKPEVKIIDGIPVAFPEDRFKVLESGLKGGVMLHELGEPDQLYINDGKGNFHPIEPGDGTFLSASGVPLEVPLHGWGLSVMLRDLNGDRAPDIYVCNDYVNSRDRIWINSGSGTFQPIGDFQLRNMSLSSMSIDFADINNDGHEDIFVADMLSRHHVFRQRQRANHHNVGFNFPVESSDYQPEVNRNTLFLNRGDDSFAEIARFSGLHAGEWTWSAAFMDVDLDGYPDLIVTNGHGHDVLHADVLKELSTKPQGRTPSERLANLRRFPSLKTKNLIFRNQGDLTFRETGAEWGFDFQGISHGMAFSDLDLDGDLDVIVNNYLTPCSLYRNESSATRVGVLLKGQAPNTEGVGAVVEVMQGTVKQIRSVINGGRYLSDDGPLISLAINALSKQSMKLKVTWRSGEISEISNVLPNCLYEISEPGYDRYLDPPLKETPDPTFVDVSQLLNHVHQDEPFDDFKVQALMPYKRSHRGPGISLWDIDGNGWDDIVIGAGRGGTMAIYRNDGVGGFQLFNGPQASRDQMSLLGWRKDRADFMMLVGSSNYEDGQSTGTGLARFDVRSKRIDEVLPAQAWAFGPMAMADVDLDGDLDLFVGGNLKAGQYPLTAPAHLLRNEKGIFKVDPEWDQVFADSGVVNGVVFSDLDMDGDPDLALACEWSPIRIFLNEKGLFQERTEEWGLKDYSGIWNGIATGDFDLDGRPDIIAGNFGRNTRYQPYLQKPYRLHYATDSESSSKVLIESNYDEETGGYVPWRDLKAVSSVVPKLGLVFRNTAAYASASAGDLLGHIQNPMEKVQINTLDSMVFLNRGTHFEPLSLPASVQFAPVFGMAVGDYNADGLQDVFLAQNFFSVEKETGRYDAGRGLWLKGMGRGRFKAIPGHKSGIRIYGQQRGCALFDFDRDGRLDLVVGQNGEDTKLYRNNSVESGLRVRLLGPSQNLYGIGAQVRGMYQGGKQGPIYEIQSGSGYLSQNSPVVVLGGRKNLKTVLVRWPGGRVAQTEIPESANEVVINPLGEIQPGR